MPPLTREILGRDCTSKRQSDMLSDFSSSTK